jgi:hypothetical protein
VQLGEKLVSHHWAKLHPLAVGLGLHELLGEKTISVGRSFKPPPQLASCIIHLDFATHSWFRAERNLGGAHAQLNFGVGGGGSRLPVPTAKERWKPQLELLHGACAAEPRRERHTTPHRLFLGPRDNFCEKFMTKTKSHVARINFEIVDGW